MATAKTFQAETIEAVISEITEFSASRDRFISQDYKYVNLNKVDGNIQVLFDCAERWYVSHPTVMLEGEDGGDDNLIAEIERILTEM